MNRISKAFPAKILLFGEYTILLGSSALSIPYPVVSAKLTFPGNNEPADSRKQVTSNHHLFAFYQYLEEQHDHFSGIIDFERFYQDLVLGIYLQSTIPAGYGLGSSGALVAAVFERFARKIPSPEELRNAENMIRLKMTLAEMESFFHGKSSGFDPLVSFLKMPVFLRSNGAPEMTSIPGAFSLSGSGIFLLDTMQTGRTSPLVKDFLDRYRPEGNIAEEGKALCGLVDDLVNAFLNFSGPPFWNMMKDFSAMQTEEFKPMIPGPFISPWLEGIKSGLFYLKLCGSGGGGYLVGLTPDWMKASLFLEDLGYSPVPVFLG